MIGKFSKVKQINHLYCVRLLPNINDKSLPQQSPERTPKKTEDKSPKKEKTLTLQRIKQKLKKEIEDVESASFGTVQKPLLTNKNPSKISNKIMDTSNISYNSRIHAIIESPIHNYQKGKSFFKRQTLYPHKVRALTEQAKKQSTIKEKQLPMFSIKLLKTFLKNNQKLMQNDSPFQIQSSPISKLCDSSQIKPKSNFKNLEQMEMNITQIQIKNSKFPRKSNHEASKNLPCFIVRRSLQHSKQYSKKRTFNFKTTNKTISNKYILIQRTHQQSQCPELQIKKKYSKQIENDLMELSTPRNYSLLRKSTRTEPSLSAWQ